MDNKSKRNSDSLKCKKMALEIEDDKPMTVKQAASFLCVCDQSVRAAIKLGRLKSFDVEGRICMLPKDIEDYDKSRWCREHTYEDDEVSVKNAAKVLKVSEQRIYYLIRTGIIKSYCKMKKKIAIKKRDLIETFGK